MGLEVFWIGVALIAAWHTIRHGTPRAFRAVGKHRRKSIDKWVKDHPNAPKSARTLAGAGYGLAALLWGPKFFARESKSAWREGWDKGKSRFRPEQYAQPEVEPEPVGVSAYRQSTCNNCRANSGPLDPAALADWKASHVCAPAAAPKVAEPARRPDGRPDLRPVPAEPTAGPAPTPTPTSYRSDDMAIETATGGEITNAEQFAAEAKAIETEAAAELEDAAGDSARAQEDLSRIERMVASLSRQSAVSNDIAAVAGLKEPAEARAQAAKDRHAAAERRLAQAKSVVAVAAKHVQMIGQAAGPFYNPRG